MADEALIQLARLLEAPLAPVDFAGLSDRWVHDDVVVQAARPAHLEDCPDLPLRMRGALGNVLAAHSAAGRFDPRPFARADSFDLLFDWDLPGLRSGAIAQPSIILTDVVGDRVEVRVRLFGLAAWHGPRVRDALVEALEGGVALRNYGVRAHFAVQAAGITRLDGAALDWGGAGDTALLRLRTPLIIRREGRLQISPGGLMRAILRRPQTLAPWMQCGLVDFAGPVPPFPKISLVGIHSERWVRTSKRDPGVNKPVEGLGGEIRFDGLHPDWIPWLRLAEMTGLGSQTALGMGCFRLNLF